MVKRIDDGGPAFPRYIAREEYNDNGTRTVLDSDGGMSLRDYFAGQALIGLMAHPNSDFDETRFALAAYAAADAMLKARHG